MKRVTNDYLVNQYKKEKVFRMSSGDWLEQKCHPVKLGIGEAGFGTRKLLIFFELTLE